MSNSQLAILALCLAACAGTSAQQMYKTVGEDGRVTFSDRPRLEAAAKLSVMRSYTLRPMKNPGEQAPSETAPAAPRPEGTASEPVTTVGPQVESAIMNVMAQAEFARRFYHFCNTTQSGARAFNQAAGGWKQRNAAAVEQQRKLLMLVVSPSKRAEIEEKVAAILTEETGKVSARTPEARAQWCTEAIAEMSSERSDIKQPEMMAVVIKPYKK